MSLLIPSYKAGFARCAAESANPNLWKGCRGLWVPSLGPTGLTLFDWSGYGNHGTLTNMTPVTDWVTSPYGHALDFDGVDDYVGLGNDLVATTEGTLSVWVRPHDVDQGNQAFIAAKEGVDQNSTFIFGFWDGNGGQAYDGRVRLAIKSQAVNTIAYGSTSLVNNTWYHIVAGKRAGGHFIYINGREESLTYTAGAAGDTQWWDDFSTPLTWRLGRQYYDNGWVNTFDGDMVNAAIWDRASTLSKARQLYSDPHAMTRLRSKVYAPAAAAGGLSNILGGGIVV